jgi:hypothetical protein
LRDVHATIRDRGADLMVIGQGQPSLAAEFVAQYSLAFPVLADPRMDAYRAAGLRRGIRTGVNLRSLRHATRAVRGGHRQGSTQGDPWQQGGVFVLGPGEVTHFEYISREAGDHPPPEAYLAAFPE